MRRVVMLLSRGRGLPGTRQRRRERNRVTWRNLVACLIILGVAGATLGGLMRLRIETTVESFLPTGDPSVTSLDQHARSFGDDPIVVLMESNAPRQLVLGDQQLPKLMKVEGTLAHLPDVATVYGPGTIMNQIAISSQDLIATISGTRDGLRARAEADARNKHESQAEVTAAGDTATADFDRRYGALLVKGLPAGLPTTNNPNFIKNVIYDQGGNPRAQWHFVVPNPNSVAVLIRPRQGIDQVSTDRLVSEVRGAVAQSGLNTSKVTVTGVPVITSAVTSEATKEIPLLAGLAVLVILLRFLVAPAGSGWFRKLWPLLASLIGSALTLASLGWAEVPMSFAVVVLLPLLLGIGSSFPLYLAAAANKRRVIAMSVASAIAFGSLAVAPLPFVRQLGIALGLGVLLTVAATVAARRTFPTSSETIVRHSRGIAEHSRTGSVDSGKRWLALGCLVAVAALGWTMLPRLNIEANPEDVARGLPELQQARYAEQVLGSSGEASIVLSGADVQSPRGLQWMQQAEDIEVSRYGDQIRPVLTAPDLLRFLGGAPTPDQIAAGIQLLPPYLTSAVFSPNGQQAIMTFGLKFQDLGQQTTLLKDVHAVLPPPPAGLHADVVGLPVAASRAYELVSRDRYLDNVAGILAAGAVLFIGLRSRSDALRAMLAAILATGWTVAGLWLIGGSLSPLTVALGSLATVTACEFTVLLGDDDRPSRIPMRRIVGWACVTSVVGYLALVPSQIGLLRDFGLTLAVTVLFSYLTAAAVIRLTVRRQPQETTWNSDVRDVDDKVAEVSS